jgi:AmmeMemoRadiSam system protein B
MSSMVKDYGCPKLRTDIEAHPIRLGADRVVCLRDPLKLGDKVLTFSHAAFQHVVLALNGSNSLADIQAHLFRKTGELIYKETLEEVIENLDRHFFLDTPRYRRRLAEVLGAFRESPVRKAAHAGISYSREPRELRAMMEGFFSAARSEVPGLTLQGEITGAIVPHIDLKTGGKCAALVFSYLERTRETDTFVILGTGHGLQESLFVLTKKDFETPLGLVRTDKEFVEALSQAYGADLTVGEASHRMEHSVEFPVLFLQYLLGETRDFRIVPVLCGSLDSSVSEKKYPAQDSDFQRFCRALRQVTASRRTGKVCTIGGADLSHVGLRYGDTNPTTAEHLPDLEKEDRAMLRTVTDFDAKAFFESIAQNGDRRRVCGFPPILAMLSCMQISKGHLLSFEIWHDEKNGSAVSYAGVIFTSLSLFPSL